MDNSHDKAVQLGASGSTMPADQFSQPRDPRKSNLKRRKFLADGLSTLGLAAGAGSIFSACTGYVTAAAPTSLNGRYERGVGVLRRVGGENYDVQLKKLAEVAPDLARFTVEYPYGDIVSREALDLEHRELCTVASLIALGSVQPQLKYHMAGFLNVGGSPRELVELVILSIAITGFPGAINATGLVRELFNERGVDFSPIPAASDSGEDRFLRGLQYLERIGSLSGLGGQDVSSSAPDLARWAIEFAAGDVLARGGLTEKQKHLSAVAMLASVGNRTDALRAHLTAALRSGVSRDEIIEVLMQMSVYAGFPAALNAFFVANNLFKDVGPLKAAEQSSAAERANRSESRAQRTERGLKTLAKTSQASGDAVIKSFNDIAPDIGHMILQHAYGDIFQRPGIDFKTRELTAVAAMAAVGSRTAEVPLRVHANAALNAGATQVEILETLYNLVPYCGYPAIQQAVTIVAEEFKKRPA